jgi:short-subunit dehydrogenase
VRATAVCPGFTRTEFHDRAGVRMSHVPERMWLAAPDVVREGLADAFAGVPVSVPSWRYKILVTAARLVPRPVLRAVMARRGF